MIIKDRKSLSITSNAKLAQMGKHQTELAEIQGSIPTGGNLFDDTFLFSTYKPSMSILPNLLNYEKCRIG